jgi:hypothetical protein
MDDDAILQRRWRMTAVSMKNGALNLREQSAYPEALQDAKV